MAEVMTDELAGCRFFCPLGLVGLSWLPVNFYVRVREVVPETVAHFVPSNGQLRPSCSVIAVRDTGTYGRNAECDRHPGLYGGARRRKRPPDG